jgi:hypothetical protein
MRASEYHATTWRNFVLQPEERCRYIEWHTNDEEGGVTGIAGSVGK